MLRVVVKGCAFEGDRQEFDTLRTFSCVLFGLSGGEVGPPGDWNVVLSTNGTDVTYKIDTGEQVNVLPKKLFYCSSNRPKLKPKL